MDNIFWYCTAHKHLFMVSDGDICPECYGVLSEIFSDDEQGMTPAEINSWDERNAA